MQKMLVMKVSNVKVGEYVVTPFGTGEVFDHNKGAVGVKLDRGDDMIFLPIHIWSCDR